MTAFTHRTTRSYAETGNVVQLPQRLSDEELVALLDQDPARAQAGIFDKHAADVEKILRRVLGSDTEIADVLHDVFITAFGVIHGLQDSSRLRSWLIGIAIHQARRLIRRRKIRRLVQIMAPFDLPEQIACHPSEEVSEALRETYSVLGQLPTEQRIAFALRFIDGMELAAVATAMGVSLATVKRRLMSARLSFVQLARESDVLCDWLERGTLAE